MRNKLNIKKFVLGISMLIVFALAACQPVPASMMETKVVPVTGMDEAEISVATDPTLGDFLVGANGMTLYVFTKDEDDKSNCDSDCLAKWPPLLTLGKPGLGDGVDASLVGSAALADGTMIVTYNGMPLYYWVNDKAAGDFTGQNVGEVWFVVSPDGELIGMIDANANDNANSNDDMDDNSNSNTNSNSNDDDYDDDDDDDYDDDDDDYDDDDYDDDDDDD